jgi:uncharacterized membrane protein
MSVVPPRPTDLEVETSTVNHLVFRVLSIGLVVSATLLVAGLIVWLARGGTLPPSVTGPVQAVRDIATLQPNGFFSLGLLTLILTPFVRVAGSTVVFVRAHDRRYALVTTTVLAIMVASLWLGGA